MKISPSNFKKFTIIGFTLFTIAVFGLLPVFASSVDWTEEAQPESLYSYSGWHNVLNWIGGDNSGDPYPVTYEPGLAYTSTDNAQIRVRRYGEGSWDRSGNYSDEIDPNADIQKLRVIIYAYFKVESSGGGDPIRPPLEKPNTQDTNVYCHANLKVDFYSSSSSYDPSELSHSVIQYYSGYSSYYYKLVYEWNIQSGAVQGSDVCYSPSYGYYGMLYVKLTADVYNAKMYITVPMIKLYTTIL